MEYSVPVLCLLGVILVAWGSPLSPDSNDDLADISNPVSSRQRRDASSCYGNNCGNQRNTGTNYGSNRRNTATSYSSNRRNTGTTYGSTQYNRCNTGNCRPQGYARPASASAFSSASSSSYSQGNAFGSASASAGTFNPAAFFNTISGRGGFGCSSGNCRGGSNFGYIPPEFFSGQGYFGNFEFPPGFNFPVYPPNNGFGTGGYHIPQVPHFSFPRLCTGYGCSGRSVSVTNRVLSRPGSQGKGVWADSSISTQNGKVSSYRVGTGRF